MGGPDRRHPAFGQDPVVRSISVSWLGPIAAVTTIEALTHTAVLHHPDILSDDGALIDEATRLVIRYLR
jgi:hypothetical protein